MTIKFSLNNDMKLIGRFCFYSCRRSIDEHNAPHSVSAFHRLIPQFLACVPVYLMNCNMGLSLAIPTIVVSSVIGTSNHLNPDETISMTVDEASWLASIAFITQPFGNVISGFLCEWLGRRPTIILVNIFPLIAWAMLAYANSKAIAYIGFGILGFGVGLGISPFSYVGEVCEALVRGAMMAIGGITLMIGMFGIYLGGAFLSWRTVSLISCLIPLAAIFGGFFIPEAPVWLLSRNRTAEAQSVLQFLRGGVSYHVISSEFEQMTQVSKLSTSCQTCIDQTNDCPHLKSNVWQKISDVRRKRTLKPFVLIVMLFVMMQFSAVFVMRPYLVPILNAHGISIDANIVTVIFAALGFVANLFIVITVRWLGKRAIYLYSMAANCLACVGLSIYGFVLLPWGWSSEFNNTASVEDASEYIRNIVGNWNYFALSMFIIMQFSVALGVSSIPYILLSEVFSFRTRAFYCGICGAINQIFAFAATKTYYDFERLLSLPGIILFYGILAIIGYVGAYLILPETELRSLEDIEFHYSDNSKPITDINIRTNLPKLIQ